MHPITSRVLALLLAASCNARAANLEVAVQNVQDDQGSVVVGLFNSADSFPKQPLRGSVAPAKSRRADGTVLVVFNDVAPGDYAVTAFHDRDGNGKLNANVMGVPLEPYGLSGKELGRLGAPQFRDVAVTIPAAGLAISIQLR